MRANSLEQSCRQGLRAILVLVFAATYLFFSTSARASLDAESIAKIGTQLLSEESDEKVQAVRQLGKVADSKSEKILLLLGDEALYGVPGATPPGSKGLVSVEAGKMIDVLTEKTIGPAPTDLESIVINNLLRTEIASALATIRLGSSDIKVRLAAAKELQGSDNEDLLPVIEASLTKEKDPEIQSVLRLAAASLGLRASEPDKRLAAVRALAKSDDPQVRQMLATMVAKNKDGSYPEQDAKVRSAVTQTLDEINTRLRKTEVGVSFFTGLSLGSILLLAALGLAITYGLMGIINMAHGEFLMIGAYMTWVTQTLFRQYLPGAFDWYLVAALPVAFLVTALLGIVLERLVLRHLYGRPLETLLTTWGISLLLIQTCRTIFGAQNVEVENPSWMSGGFALAGGSVIPFNRVVILLFSLAVLFAVWLILNRSRMGLFVRAVTQNRTMASCTGVPTHRVDVLTFGLGCGVAGLGGVALSQIGNVGPDLGQSYIVDSFMVVVLGGVGQLAGTVIAALGLGATAKVLEPFSGAVLAKIFILIFIILFIQKRPQGLFALKGRSAES